MCRRCISNNAYIVTLIVAEIGFLPDPNTDIGDMVEDITGYIGMY